MPDRNRKRVTQPFSDGIVTIFSIKNGGKPGYLPKEVWTEKYKLCYQENRLGVQRLYLGRQNQIEIARVLRVPRVEGVTNQDMAVTQDDRRYRIDAVQTVEGVYPPSLDLSLTRIRQGVDADDMV